MTGDMSGTDTQGLDSNNSDITNGDGDVSMGQGQGGFKGQNANHSAAPSFGGLGAMLSSVHKASLAERHERAALVAVLLALLHTSSAGLHPAVRIVCVYVHVCPCCVVVCVMLCY